MLVGLALMFSVLGWRLRPAFAQEERDDTPPPPPADVTSIFSLPDVLKDGTLNSTKIRLYLFDKFGKQVLVPSDSLENYLEYKRNKASQLPNVSLEAIDVQVDVAGEVASVVSAFDARLVKSESNAASLPLLFETVQLTQPAELTPKESSWLRVGESGYRWLLHGEADSKHRALLRGESKVARNGDRYELRLVLPAAMCSLKIRLPVTALDDSVRGQGNEIVRRTKTEQAVAIEVNGRGGEIVVSWRMGVEHQRVSAVEATSTSRMAFEDLRQPWKVNSDVSLRWFGEDSNDRIAIALPEGARWSKIPTANERFTVSGSMPPEATSAAGTNNSNPVSDLQQLIGSRNTLVIRNSDPSPMQPLELRVEWEWQPPSVNADTHAGQFALPSLSIDGVDSHAGKIEVLVPTNYIATWQENSGTQFVQQGRVSDSLDRNSFLFQFSRQPFELIANFRRQSNTATVRPIYLAHVDSHKIKLTAWFDCAFAASQPLSVSLKAEDWSFESAEVVDPATPLASGEPLDVETQTDGSVIINNPDPSLSEFSERGLRQLWRVVAYRARSENNTQNSGVIESQVEVRLPQFRPSDGVGRNTEYQHGSGVLMITSEENVLLKWKESATQGLLVDSLVPQWQSLLPSQTSKSPLVYRFQNHHDTPVWVGGMETLPQQISGQQQCTLAISDGLIRINQSLKLQITHEPLKLLRIAIRQDVTQRQEPQVLIDGTPVTLRATASNDALQSAWQMYELVTAGRLQGTVTLNVRTSMAWISEGPLQLISMSVPLAQFVLPQHTRIQDQNWNIAADRNIEVFEGVENEGAITKLLALANGPHEMPVGQVEIPLRVRKLDSLASQPTRVGRSWLQTVFNGDERRDRYCAQIESKQSLISIRIPSGRKPTDVTIDGKKVRPSDTPGIFTDEGTQIQIELPASERGEHQIEIWMLASEPLSWASRLDIVVPEIEDSEFRDRFYWQLALPSTYHLGFGSARMTPEWVWRWRGLVWQRTTSLTQAELERWVGATPQADLPQSANSYVLSSFGGGRSFEVTVLSRLVLWLPTGLAAILLTTLMVTFRRLRHPSILLLAAGVLSTLAMLSPDMAILVGQTALASMGIVALLLITQAAVESRVRRRSVFSVRPASYAERSDHFSLARNIKVAPPSTTRSEAAVAADRGP